MFEMLKDIGKATIGLVFETPIAVVKDIATLGGVITDKNEPYTMSSLNKVVKNVANATKPD